MEEVHIYPSAHIKPNLYKQIRVILTAPTDIRRTGIEMTPDHPVSTGGGSFSTLFPDRINNPLLFGMNDCPNPQIFSNHIAGYWPGAISPVKLNHLGLCKSRQIDGGLACTICSCGNRFCGRGLSFIIGIPKFKGEGAVRGQLGYGQPCPRYGTIGLPTFIVDQKDDTLVSISNTCLDHRDGGIANLHIVPDLNRLETRKIKIISDEVLKCQLILPHLVWQSMVIKHLSWPSQSSAYLARGQIGPDHIVKILIIILFSEVLIILGGKKSNRSCFCIDIRLGVQGVGIVKLETLLDSNHWGNGVIQVGHLIGEIGSCPVIGVIVIGVSDVVIIGVCGV